jgi:hypothetical protein
MPNQITKMAVRLSRPLLDEIRRPMADAIAGTQKMRK